VGHSHFDCKKIRTNVVEKHERMDGSEEDGVITIGRAANRSR
jgi:hypothetical protein